MAEIRNGKLIKYLNLDFKDFVKDLEDFSKIYFPRNSKDFSEFSSAKMMLEQSAFIGDVLAFYTENRFLNSNMVTATDIVAVTNLSEFLGWKFLGPTAARGEQTFYLEVPAKTGSNGETIPDMDYAVNFKNVQLQNNNGITFEALDDVDFTSVNPSGGLDVKVSERNAAGNPTYYVLRTKAEILSGKTVTETITIGDYAPFKKVELPQKNVIEVLSVTDSEGDKWYEVDYHAQEVIFEGVKNLSDDKEDVPYLLKLRAVPKRFVTKTDPLTGKTSLIFGPGKASEVGDSFVPDPSVIALNLKGNLTLTPTAIDPQNFLKTRTLGLAPYNTTLTINFRVGGGRITNTAQRSIKDITSKQTELNGSNLNTQKLNRVLSSFSTENEGAIQGGEEAPTIDEIKQQASAFFAAQGRVNTDKDYIARSLSMPQKLGKIFRVYPTVNTKKNGGVQLYVIAKNHLNQLTTPTENLKRNLKNYLSLFTRIGQGIDILDGKIINIGIEYVILVAPGYNKTKVKISTLEKVRSYFAVDNWQLNQPIILDELKCLIMETEGVVSVPELMVVNKNNIIDNQSYSEYVYDIAGNTKNGIIFGRADSMFEVKFPLGKDIKVGAL